MFCRAAEAGNRGAAAADFPGLCGRADRVPGRQQDVLAAPQDPRPLQDCGVLHLRGGKPRPHAGPQVGAVHSSSPLSLTL